MKAFKGDVLKFCDSYEENEDGSCQDVVEIIVQASSLEELEKVKKRMKCYLIFEDIDD